MGRILGKRTSLRAPGKQSQKYAYVFHSRDQLFDTDACNMERRHRCPDIGIAFVGADHEGSCFSDSKIAPRHARSRCQKSGTCVVSHDLSQKVRIIVPGISTDGPCEYLRNVLACFVDGGEHNMARGLAIELLGSFTQIRFDDLDSPVLQEGAHL